MSRSTPLLPLILLIIALLGFASAGGFFYAYSSSVMVGLDASPPAAAIEAMQGINREVRNFWFAISFFGAPVYGAVTAVVCFIFKFQRAALMILIATLIYLGGTFAITVVFHLPLNEELASVPINQTPDQLAIIWQSYSVEWTFWNTIRAVAALISTVFVAIAMMIMGKKSVAIPK